MEAERRVAADAAGIQMFNLELRNDLDRINNRSQDDPILREVRGLGRSLNATRKRSPDDVGGWAPNLPWRLHNDELLPSEMTRW